jgi:hypothetical protein
MVGGMNCGAPSEMPSHSGKMPYVLEKFKELEKSGEDYVFDRWNIDHSPDRKGNVSLGTSN